MTIVAHLMTDDDGEERYGGHTAHRSNSEEQRPKRGPPPRPRTHARTAIDWME